MTKTKVIETLKDLKDVLASIPDADLENFVLSTNDEGGGELTVVTSDEFHQIFHRNPQIRLVSAYIKNICKCQDKIKADDEFSLEGEPVTSAKGQFKNK